MKDIKSIIKEIFNNYDPLSSYDGTNNCYDVEVNALFRNLKDIHLNEKEMSKYFHKTYMQKYDNNDKFISELINTFLNCSIYCDTNDLA
jgi:tRNA A-37 threonylcarbamoyl transferase component Bud32